MASCNYYDTSDVKQTFDAWYACANQYCLATCGLGVEDLADGPSYDAFADGVTVQEYVDGLLADEGFSE